VLPPPFLSPGSSNIDCNVSTGTIFAVYEKLPESHFNHPTEADIMRTGNDIVVAGVNGGCEWRV
jgi:fructose-1,6-bisphosphatase I